MNNKIQLEYDGLKLEFNKILHDETLKKYKILSKAYYLGLKIYGRNKFTLNMLAEHFDIPKTTCKRIMSLKRANINTWKLIKSGKLSSFKATQICLTKNILYQDEIVKAVINDNLSTYQISKYSKANSLEKVKEIRLKLAIKKGFARNNSAFVSFKHYIFQLNKMLDMPLENLPKEKLQILFIELNKLLIKIKDYIENEKSKMSNMF